jgi:hypothetical protein
MSKAQAPAGFSAATQTALQTPWRALVSSLSHDLAQPLTNLRCFLEVAGMRKGTLVTSASDLKAAEQQADRAIVVVKTISSLVREISVPTGPWISLNSLLDRIFDDFVVLEQCGLLTLERRWDSAIQVTSNPALQQLLALLTGKLAIRNTRPITLIVSATMVGTRCHLEIRWRPSDKGTVADAETTLAADLVYIQEIVFSLGGEIAFEGETGISLKLPGMLQSSQNIIAS